MIRWMASGAVRMYGVSYSEEQSVNISTWTPAQVQQQVYLGNIVPDTRVGNTTQYKADGGTWNNTYTNFHVFSFGARGTFTAPPSGRALFHTHFTAAGSQSNSTITMRLEIYPGTSASGTLHSSSDRAYARGIYNDVGSLSHLTIGMSPGAVYTVAQAFTATAGGGTLTNDSRIIYEPLPA